MINRMVPILMVRSLVGSPSLPSSADSGHTEAQSNRRSGYGLYASAPKQTVQPLARWRSVYRTTEMNGFIRASLPVERASKKVRPRPHRSDPTLTWPSSRGWTGTTPEVCDGACALRGVLGSTATGTHAALTPPVVANRVCKPMAICVRQRTARHGQRGHNKHYALRSP